MRTSRLVLSAALFAFSGTAAAQAPRNIVRDIRVEPSGASRAVRIRTAGEPTFTVFRLSDPMRVVVDISGGDLSQLQGALMIEDGVVGQIASRQFNAGGLMVGRVIVGFEKEVAYSVRADGNAVVITAGDAPTAPVESAPPPPVAPADRVAAERFESAKREAEAEAQSARREREEANRVAAQARAQQEEATRISAEADRLADEARRAKGEAEQLRKQAKESAERDRARAEQLAQAAEVKEREVQRQAQEIARERAAAERLAVESEQARRDAEAVAAQAEAQHKKRVAEIEEMLAQAQQQKAAAHEARQRADQARVEAETAQKALVAAQSDAERSRQEVARKLEEITSREAKAQAALATVAVKEARADEALREAHTARQAVESEKRRIDEQAKALSSRSEELANRQQALSGREKDLSSRDQTLAAERLRLEALRQQLASERASLSDARRRNAEAAETQRKEETQLASEVEAQKAKVESERRALEVLKRELESQQKSLAAARDALKGEAKDIEKERLSVESARIAAETARLAAESARRAAEKASAERKADAATAERKAAEAATAEKKAAEALAAARKAADAAAAERKAAALAAERRIADELVAERKALAEDKPSRPLLASLSNDRPAPVATEPHTKFLGVEKQGKGKNAGVLLRLDGTPEYQVLRVDDPPRLVVDLQGTDRNGKRSSYGVDHKLVRRVRLGEQGSALRAVLDLADENAEHQVEVTGKGLLVSVRLPSAAPRGSEADGDTGPLDPTEVSEKNLLRDVRFDGKTGVARVVLDLGAAKVSPRIDDRSPRAWVLALDNVRVAKALERTLDTTAFGTAVRTISTYQASEDPPVVNVVANLSADAKGDIKREGQRLIWEIRGAPTPTPAPAPSESVAETAPSVATNTSRTAGFASDAAAIARTTAPAQAAARSGGSGSASRRRISIDLKDAEIKNVLRLLAEVSGENIITSDDVKGNITLKLRNVPWDTALDTILKLKGYDRVRQNNIMRIAPAEVLQKEREFELARKKTEAEVEPTAIKIITINYATATEIVGQVKPMLTGRGTVQVDARTNTLIVEDVRSNINRVVDLIQRLDRQTPQVLIEARIVEASTNFLNQLGIQWGGVSANSAAGGNPTGLQFPGDINVTGAADDANTASSGVNPPSNFAVNLPAAIGNGKGGGLGFVFGSAGGSQLLNLRLTALEDNGSGRIISAPRITTLDNRLAKIEQGFDVPVATTSAAGANVRFVPAVLSLEVTPHVTNDGSVLMKIKVAKNEPDFGRPSPTGVPIIKKYAETEVLVHDGDTSVIGGIYTRSTSEAVSQVPLLGSIPILGWLFKTRRQEDTRAELLVFLTPRIVNREAAMVDTSGEMESLKRDEEDPKKR